MQDIFPTRIRLFQFIIIASSIIFLIKIAIIQLDDRNKIKSKDNAVKEFFIYPNRGQIYDRNNILLVHNKNVYEIMVAPLEVDDDLDINLLCSDLQIDTNYFNKQMSIAKKTSLYRPFVFMKHVPTENYQRFQEHSFKYKGFYGQIRSMRNYPYPVAALLFGTIGEVDSNTIQQSTDYQYLSGDYVGKSGIELSYEAFLRGQRGVKTVLVDALNRVKGSYANGKFDREPVAGDDLVCTIDIGLQELGEKMLHNKNGSVIAIEPKTGEILAMATGPNFDPNFLSGNQRNFYYSQLLTNYQKPLLNRTIQGVYPPGSIFKAITGLVSLQMGAIRPSFSYYCPGYYKIGHKLLKCSHRHAPCRNVVEGLTQSCNPYFFQTFRNSIEVKNSKNVGDDYDRWRRNIVRFGLSRKTGIDLVNEKRGFIPDTTFYNKLYPYGWKPTTIISLGIGQGEILMTPLQMANSYCVIANSGYFITPHAVKQIRHNGKTVKNNHVINKVTLPINPGYFEYVLDGLENVVERGTARSAAIPGIKMCGKTGTAQNPHGQSHSIFVGFAPKEDPKIVVACVVENGGSGGSIAAPIVSVMIAKYLNKELNGTMLSRYNSVVARNLNNFKINEYELINNQ